jgi:hypothetical protein
MRAITRTTTLALAATLLVGGSPGIHAQSPEPSADPLAPAHITGRYTYGGHQTVSPTVTVEDGVTHYRGGETWEGIGVSSSDPRFTGKASFTFDRDLYPDRFGAVWGTGVITNEAGSWTGTSVGAIRPGDGIAWRTWDQFTGSGAYEGLTIMLIKENTGEFEGVILPTPE